MHIIREKGSIYEILSTSIYDRKYKKKEEMLEAEQGTAIGLCAWRLEFAHPKTGKKMKFEVQPEGACFQEFSEAIKP